MDNFIEVYSNVLSKNHCEEVIKVFEQLNELGFCKNRQEKEEANTLSKDDSSIYNMEIFDLTHINNRGLVKEFNDILWETCYKQYSDKYSTLKIFSRHDSYSYKIQKTKPGQGYHVWHAEADSPCRSSRILAWTAYLNDDFEAGETEFLYQQCRYKPNQGDIVIFPAAFTHTHRGNPPIGGDKYIITGWIEF